MTTATTTARRRRRTGAAVVGLTRPWFWPLSWAPVWFGTVLATGTWMPAPGDLARFVGALLVTGPLVWGAVCSANDLHDLPTDRVNPRKVSSPLVTGDVSAAEVGRWCAMLSVATVAVALVVGPLFALGTAGVVALGLAYSVPPVRLKSRPGLDIVANAVPLGLLAPLAGWSLHRPVTDYPLLLAMLGLTLAAALYLPTLVMDRVPDTAVGIRTFAVRWGARVSYRVGVLLWGAATAAWLLCLASGALGQGDVGPRQIGFAAVPLVTYAWLTRHPSIARMALVCASFCLPAADFLLSLGHAPLAGA